MAYVVLEQKETGWAREGEEPPVFDVPWEPTVAELLGFMKDNDIPYTATLKYHACGSHTMALEWEDPREVPIGMTY